MISLKPHPINPHGVLIPCAHCGREIHAPRADFIGARIIYLPSGGTHVKGPMDPIKATCSYACMSVAQGERT